jgi:plastocyanin
MPDRRIGLLSAAALLLVMPLAAGCASDAAARARVASPVLPTTVNMPPSYRFDPVSVEVPSGSTVTWSNADNFTHSVQVDGQGEVRVAKPGESVQVRFDQPGTFTYICTFHTQDMRGTVIVR